MSDEIVLKINFKHGNLEILRCPFLGADIGLASYFSNFWETLRYSEVTASDDECGGLET